MNVASLDSCFPHGYGNRLPAGSGPGMIAAAEVYERGMDPASPAERQRVLLGLRQATIIRREDEAEAEATLKILRVHLEDVPLDILETACRAYCNAPGQRFFPRSAGELRTFTNPLMRERSGRAFRLRWLAEQADLADAKQRELDDDPLTPEAASAIMEEFGIGRAKARIPEAEPSAKREPETATIEKYIALGLSEGEARQAMVDHERLLSRGRGKPISGAATLGADIAAAA